jgi:hypothetical protein
VEFVIKVHIVFTEISHCDKRYIKMVTSVVAIIFKTV